MLLLLCCCVMFLKSYGRNRSQKKYLPIWSRSLWLSGADPELVLHIARVAQASSIILALVNSIMKPLPVKRFDIKAFAFITGMARIGINIDFLATCLVAC